MKKAAGGLFVALLVGHVVAGNLFAGPDISQKPGKGLSTAPVDVAIGAGVLDEGAVIPLPAYSDGTVAADSDCHWIVSPASQEMGFTCGPDTSGFMCHGGQADCYPEGRIVVCNFEDNCGYWPGQANYLIIATRRADLGRPESCRAVAVRTGIIDDGGTIPLPTYSDGTVAEEGDCRWIVNPASQWLHFSRNGDPGPLFCYDGRADCYTEGRVVVANYESDCGTWSGQATYLIIGTRPATTRHPGLCSDLALETGVLWEGGTVPLPHYWDATVATESSCGWLTFRASQWIGIIGGSDSDPLFCDQGRVDCYPEGRRVVANFENECGYWPGQATYMIIGERPVYVAYSGIGNDTVPPKLALHQNAPNPFNPRTTIRFDLPAAGPVRLAVYDLAGRLVRVLVEGEIPAGSHEAVWDGRDATGRSSPSGSYLARLEAGGKVEGVRLSLVR